MDAKFTSGVPLNAATPHQMEHRLRLLVDTGIALAAERDGDRIAQIAVDTALSLSCARFGIFFFETHDTDGAPAHQYKFAVEHPVPAAPSTPALDVHFTLVEESPFHCGDINAQPHIVERTLFDGTPFAAENIRSLLSVPVRNRGGILLGGILLAHPGVGKFSPVEEVAVVTVAAQAAAALENAYLARTLSQEIGYADAARRAEHDATRRLRQALDAAELGTWTWNLSTDLLDLDDRAAELLNGGDPHHPVSRAELRKRIVHRDDMGATASDMRQALLSEGSYSAEYRVEGHDGKVRWVASRGVATYTADEDDPNKREVTGMIGTIQDITTRKTQEATLRQTEKLAATGRLAATIAHEINNPLEAVTNLIYLSKTDPSVPAPIQHLLNTADNELARVSQIAQQTLGFYRDTTRPVDIDLSQLLEGVVNLFSRKMDYKKIRCDLDVKSGLHIFGLQGEVRQVFSNLLVNAIDASSKSTIRIRARALTQKGKLGVSVMIIDQGTGIPESVRQQLFSPFFTTKESTGTGLGLWVTRGLVEKQGGSIRFRTCTAPPTGTVFRVFLPAEFLKPENFPPARTKAIQ